MPTEDRRKGSPTEAEITTSFKIGAQDLHTGQVIRFCCHATSTQFAFCRSSQFRLTQSEEDPRACRLWREISSGAPHFDQSAVNSLVAKRMVKSQQMRWPPSGAHLMLQARAAMVNGNLRQRLRHKPDLPTLPLHPIFQPTPPLLKAA